MADVLNVIADIIKQDKQQKREHAKVMREVQKKLKEHYMTVVQHYFQIFQIEIVNMTLIHL